MFYSYITDECAPIRVVSEEKLKEAVVQVANLCFEHIQLSESQLIYFVMDKPDNSATFYNIVHTTTQVCLFHLLYMMCNNTYIDHRYQ